MITAPTLEELFERMLEAERHHPDDHAAHANYLAAHAAYQRALIVQARADAAMRGEP